ncbi:PREDICTED: zinc finger A20 and AN1 domain-containing stress-associated protein 10-like [Camelina sativa]|uniref:Zinc finger A20 and AN1 domain-containing stress-associated protein 10-like n=1 Tax=Camelina sativa TaxID=90675 RepID=A0ABM0UZ61_CAMSA|nr:PREDICTED: zinc finger A20 and AN1 domain-containing stress-associated protein 10-like [Camelina sativa]
MMTANETEALLCAGGCGYYGNREKNNLCSLCYKQSVLEQQSAAPLRFELETPPTSSPVAAEEPVGKRRCGICKRKVGVLGFKCRCGHMFCGSHRYPEEHSCPFDYKQSGRVALATQLPLTRADKLQRF